MSNYLDNALHIALGQRRVHRQLQRMFGSFSGRAAGLEFLEHIENVADVDMHDFDI
jgi:hypothetical protein